MTATTCADWRPIAGYEGRYSISSDGRVRSERRRVPRARREIPERILAPQTHQPSGLESVTLFIHNKPRRRYLHRLRAEAFPELTDAQV